MTINQAEANRVGLTPAQVADQVSGALLGEPAGEIRLDDRSIGVRVRAPDSVRFDPRLLGAIPVFSPQTHSAVPLGALATFQPIETRARAAAREPAADDHRRRRTSATARSAR